MRSARVVNSVGAARRWEAGLAEVGTGSIWAPQRVPTVKALWEGAGCASRG